MHHTQLPQLDGMSTNFQKHWEPERSVEINISYEMESKMRGFSTYFVCWEALRGTEFDLGEEKEWMSIPDDQPAMVRAIANDEWVKLLKEKNISHKTFTHEPLALTRHSFYRPGRWIPKFEPKNDTKFYP